MKAIRRSCSKISFECQEAAQTMISANGWKSQFLLARRNMRAALVLCLALCVVSSLALVIKPTHKRPLGWKRDGEPAKSHPIRLQFALKQRNMDLVEETLLRVSDPREPTYGEWMSLEQLTEMIAPSHSEVQLVLTWLENFG